MSARVNFAEVSFLKAEDVNYILLNSAKKICIFFTLCFPMFESFFLCVLKEKTNHSLAHL